jgi:hypothetical protein
MPEVGRRYWILYYAAQGGNWELAAYQLRQIAQLFRLGGTTRPKMERHLEAFRLATLEQLAAAVAARNWEGFDSVYRAGIESANRFHVTTGHPEIRWRLPDEPPPDLELGPSPGESGATVDRAP